MSSPQWFSRLMILVIAFTLCGGPQLASAQQTAPQQNDQQQPVDQNSTSQQNVGTTQENATPDPSKGPLKPNDQQLPNAPSATQQQQQPQTSQDQQQSQEAPLGAAAAQAAKTSGGAASKPAGTAIAPAKQRQTRSLLIKIGAIAAGAAAVGIVYGLSRGTSSVPPGANRTTSAATAGTAQH